ncbi:MAG: nitroreductase [Chloroflexi bacterium RBG_13_57_8]|nr:MAG: nitroreductase [Chloroflexi bacterium RBG_13_57_8]
MSLILILIVAVFLTGCIETINTPSASASGETVNLPIPRLDSDFSLEKAILQRRSVRSFGKGALTLAELSQVLWAAQGVTDPSSGKRSAPSAGALYPLELYIVAGNVSELPPAVYKYKPASHSLVRVKDGDFRQSLSRAAMGQSSVLQGAIDIVITAVYGRVTAKYGEWGTKFAHLEAGHAAQNVCLQVVALGLGTVTVGSFEDASVQEVLGAAAGEIPLYILPVGRTD